MRNLRVKSINSQSPEKLNNLNKCSTLSRYMNDNDFYRFVVIFLPIDNIFICHSNYYRRRNDFIHSQSVTNLLPWGQRNFNSPLKYFPVFRSFSSLGACVHKLFGSYFSKLWDTWAEWRLKLWSPGRISTVATLWTRNIFQSLERLSDPWKLGLKGFSRLRGWPCWSLWEAW